MHTELAGRLLTGVAIVVATATFAAAEDAAKTNVWKTSLSIGANMASGNTETRGLNGSLVSEMTSDRYDGRVGVEANYSSATTRQTTDGVETTRRDTTADNTKIFANGKRKFDMNYIYSDNSWFRDRAADIDSRLVFGAGVGRFLINSTNTATKLGTDVGVAYMREELANQNADDSMVYRVSARLDQKLSETAKIWLSGEYLPKADRTQDYLLNGEAGIEAALSTKLNLRLVVQERYDSEPPTDRKKNDLVTTASVTYKF